MSLFLFYYTRLFCLHVVLDSALHLLTRVMSQVEVARLNLLDLFFVTNLSSLNEECDCAIRIFPRVSQKTSFPEVCCVTSGVRASFRNCRQNERHQEGISLDLNSALREYKFLT
jgi:hypothetical protein